MYLNSVTFCHILASGRETGRTAKRDRGERKKATARTTLPHTHTHVVSHEAEAQNRREQIGVNVYTCVVVRRRVYAAFTVPRSTELINFMSFIQS